MFKIYSNLFFILLIFSCASHKSTLKIHNSHTVSTPLAQIYFSAVNILQNHQYNIEHADVNSAFLSTHWKFSENFVTKIRTKFEITFHSLNSQQTKIIVKPQVQALVGKNWKNITRLGEKDIRKINQIIKEITHARPSAQLIR